MAGFDPKAYLAESDSPSFDPKAYAADDEPGFWKQTAKAAVNELPAIGGIAGGILGTPADAIVGPAGNMAGAAIGGYLGTATKNLINRVWNPEEAPKTTAEALTQPVVSGVEQGLAQGSGEAISPYVASSAKAIADPISDWMSSVAAKKAVTATGATGKQALKFAPDAGQELLDRGIVKFGDTQARVAQKATDALEDSGNKIGSVLSDLDKRGVTVDQSNIISSLRARASQLSKDPSQFGVSDQLNKLADRMETMIQANGGTSTIPIGEAEVTKRGFQTGANYNSAPLDLSVSKEAAGIYQKAVEDAATAADPKAAAAFKEAKESYKLLSPIQDAAEKRAATAAQSPHGGLLDVAATIAGEGAAGPAGAIAAPIARRAIAPRIASSIAASANAASKAIGAAPGAAEGVVPAMVQSQFPGSRQSVANTVGNLIELPAAAQSMPAKGPDAWAQQGIQKLGIKDSGMQSRLMSDPKGKQLLIQASDLTPGSKAFKNLQAQIQKGWGQG